MSNDGGWSSYLDEAMRRAKFGTAAELSRASGIDQTQISRWLRGLGQPSLDNLRRLAPALGRPMLELVVASGHLTRDEARLRDVRAEDPTVVSVPDAVEGDEGLIEEAKQHLINQYQLLRRLSEHPDSKGIVRPPLRAVARKRPSPRAER